MSADACFIIEARLLIKTIRGKQKKCENKTPLLSLDYECGWVCKGVYAASLGILGDYNTCQNTTFWLIKALFCDPKNLN